MIDHKNFTIDGESVYHHFSHFEIYGERYLNEACYSLLRKVKRGTLITVFFFEVHPQISQYVNWVTNESEFAYIYKTKSAEEGFRDGFEVYISESYEDMIDALRLIRMTNEFWRDFEGYLSVFKRHGPKDQWIMAMLSVVREEGEGHIHTLEPYNSKIADFAFSGRPIESFKEYI